ncbi:MAG: actin-like ATPase domain-containing [Lasallia pustulata]|uniref:Phosphotransferase n=1 Tax=Lasallia pustulata TaxID=136370 RepID=A0A5M8PU88_9LECA|nr:MAG: actin-like ATPase domain-containing [Lasallia pustulata]
MAKETMLMTLPCDSPFLIPTVLPPKQQVWDLTPRWERKMENLLEEVEQLFQSQLGLNELLSMSRKLQAESTTRIRWSPRSMLPSHNYNLPTGEERGTYLVLDVGGSTLRVAMVELNGRQRGQGPLRIRRMECHPIDASIKALKDVAFFDWIAGKIDIMLASDKGYRQSGTEPLAMGVAWSFPIKQTSIRSGKLLSMGKSFVCSGSVVGQDLNEVITKACQRRKLHIRLDAIVNDSSATLLSRAYTHHATRIALIFGTGMNAAIYLPTRAFTALKLDSSRTQPASHVLVNAELSMFGKAILPTTRWDDHLNQHHLLPDYQPFEYLVTGAYLGEIVRLILVEAARSAGLFNGLLPPSLLEPYALDTHSIAIVEADTSPSLSRSRALFCKLFPSPSPPTQYDLRFVQRVVACVSRRASAYLAAGIHALWSLHYAAEGLDPRGADQMGRVMRIGCNGSVINKYPGFRERCQGVLDDIMDAEGLGRGRVVLESAEEGSVLGAGVAAALAGRS